MALTWQWERASKSYANYGNANQWTVNAGLASLARESAQNANDARVEDEARLEYTFIRLTGIHREQFEAAVGWPSLHSHLAAMASNADAAVTARQIKDGVEALADAGELVLLRIADYNCKGLTGPEFNDVDESTYGNFIKLCRLDLFSGKDEAAGGSYGLGKAVYWRFSRLQTVLFNSVLRPSDAVDGNHLNRLFGVNAGVIHTVNGTKFQGRGHFGTLLESDDIASVWADEETVSGLHLERTDGAPGTSALLIGFYDPDEPEPSLDRKALLRAAASLRLGVTENFWPLLSRGRLAVTIRVIDDGEVIRDERVDPSEDFTELVEALGRFDRGEISEDLAEPGAIVVRDIPISISERKGIDPHPPFTHIAKLVVTLSDDEKDTLENSVCLFRRPEMVVEQISREFEGRTYHAFLLAGAAIDPGNPTHDDVRADDFLRFAEPPAHDRWIPGSGRTRTAQSNLTGRYVQPWVPNLRRIENEVLEALFALFGTPPPTDSRGPEAILRNLRFLRGDPGERGSGAGTALRKPEVQLTDWRVEDGAWHVMFEIKARNRDDGWLVEPELRFVGLDGRGAKVAWTMTAVAGCEVEESLLRIPQSGKGRRVTAVARGVSGTDLPIPATEAAVEVVLSRILPSNSTRAHDENETEVD